MQNKTKLEVGEPKTNIFDYAVENHGTIFLVRPMNNQAAQNLDVNVGDDGQFFGGALVVEHRYIAEFVEKLQTEGWIIK